MAPETREQRIIRESAEAEREVARLQTRLGDLEAQSKGTTEAMADLADAQLEAAKAALALAKQEGATDDVINDLTGDIRELTKASKAYAEALAEAEEKAEKFANAGTDLGQSLAGLIPVLGGNVDYMDTYGGKLAVAAVNAGSLSAGLEDVVGGFAAAMNPTQVYSNLLSASIEMMAGWLLSSFALGKEVQEQSAEFNKATGMAQQYDQAIMATVRANTSAGVSVAEVNAAYQDLITGTAKFTDMTKSQQSAIASTTSVLNELGIGSATTSQNLNIMTTSLNMNASEAEHASRRLYSAAQAMGVAPEEMASDFAAAGAQFASFGDNAVDAFIDLKEVAKKTGIELQNLISITEKFTTFEGAADSVGQLNALLGGPFLNTIDMVTLSLEDPAAAMQEVRNAVLDAGLSFEDMNPAMRRAVAAAAGLEDAGQLAALMSGEMDGLGGASSATAAQLEELKEATKFTQSFADEMEATRLAFTANFEPIIKLAIGFLNIMQDLAEALTPGGTILATILFFTFTIGFAFKKLKAAIAGAIDGVRRPIDSMNESLQRIADTLENTSDEALEKFGSAIEETIEATDEAGPSFMAVGGAIALIGVGIGVAALGMAQFVKAFSELSGGQLVAATLGIGMFSLAFYGFVTALIGLVAGPQAGLTAAAIGVLYAIGGAVALIGVGIAVAATGMSLLISSIGELGKSAEDFKEIGKVFEELSIPKMVTYTTAMTATAAVGMTPAGIALAATAAAVGGVGGGGGAPAAPTKVEVNIKGNMNELFTLMDKRYVKSSSVTPGASTNSKKL